jgi:hypothetical protein
MYKTNPYSHLMRWLMDQDEWWLDASLHWHRIKDMSTDHAYNTASMLIRTADKVAFASGSRKKGEDAIVWIRRSKLMKALDAHVGRDQIEQNNREIFELEARISELENDLRCAEARTGEFRSRFYDAQDIAEWHKNNY